MTTTQSSGELLARLGTDGRAWAEEFGKTAIALAARLEHEAGGDDPGGWLHGWFANAIEAGRSAGAAAVTARAEQAEAAIERARTVCDEAEIFHGDPGAFVAIGINIVRAALAGEPNE